MKSLIFTVFTILLVVGCIQLVGDTSTFPNQENEDIDECTQSDECRSTKDCQALGFPQRTFCNEQCICQNYCGDGYVNLKYEQCEMDSDCNENELCAECECHEKISDNSLTIIANNEDITSSIEKTKDTTYGIGVYYPKKAFVGEQIKIDISVQELFRSAKYHLWLVDQISSKGETKLEPVEDPEIPFLHFPGNTDRREVFTKCTENGQGNIEELKIPILRVITERNKTYRGGPLEHRTMGSDIVYVKNIQIECTEKAKKWPYGNYKGIIKTTDIKAGEKFHHDTFGFDLSEIELTLDSDISEEEKVIIQLKINEKKEWTSYLNGKQTDRMSGYINKNTGNFGIFGNSGITRFYSSGQEYKEGYQIFIRGKLNYHNENISISDGELTLSGVALDRDGNKQPINNEYYENYPYFAEIEFLDLEKLN